MKSYRKKSLTFYQAQQIRQIQVAMGYDDFFDFFMKRKWNVRETETENFFCSINSGILTNSMEFSCCTFLVGIQLKILWDFFLLLLLLHIL